MIKNKITKPGNINSTTIEKNYINDEDNIKSSRILGEKNYNNNSINVHNISNNNIDTKNNICDLVVEKSDLSLIKSNNVILNENNEPSIQIETIYNQNIKSYYTLKNDKDDTLIFESRFESGNLLCAFKTEEEDSYQLYLQNDTNTTGYIQWFFFRVSNTRKGKKVNFNIINMLRKKCIYKRGLKIMVYSKLEANNENIGWHRDGNTVIYYTNNLYVMNERSGKKRSLHSLSFDYEFKYDNDTVYFANCIPYFFTKITNELSLHESKYN